MHYAETWKWIHYGCLMNGQSPWALQFRPEKDHAKQLRAFAAARRRADAEWTPASEAVIAARLKLIGSCRNQGDEQRVAHLVSSLSS